LPAGIRDDLSCDSAAVVVARVQRYLPPAGANGDIIHSHISAAEAHRPRRQRGTLADIGIETVRRNRISLIREPICRGFVVDWPGFEEGDQAYTLPASLSGFQVSFRELPMPNTEY